MKGPPLGWIKIGLDSYIDPKWLIIHRVSRDNHVNHGPDPSIWCCREQEAPVEKVLKNVVQCSSEPRVAPARYPHHHLFDRPFMERVARAPCLPIRQRKLVAIEATDSQTFNFRPATAQRE